MTSVLSPSTSTYRAGKRLLSSPQDAFASPVDKKSRQYDNESNNMDYSECSQQQFKKTRLQLHNLSPQHSGFPTSNSTMDQKYLEFQHYESINKNLNENVMKKSSEISQLLAQIAAMENSNKSLYEENKLLKRAVSIQDTKIRDASSQNEQLKQHLTQAYEIINSLEKVNNNLREEIGRSYNGSFGGGFMPPQPPDVY